MARPARFKTRIFSGSAIAGDGGLFQFGSKAAGSPVATTNPATIQALGEWLSGWSSAILAGNSPTLEDMNAVQYVTSYLMDELYTLGVADWDAGTTYWLGSLAQNAAGNIYISLIDNNTNHALTDTTRWMNVIGESIEYNNGNSGAAFNIDLLKAQNQRLILTASCTLTITNPKVGFSYLIFFQQGGAGGYTLSYPGEVLFPSGVAPTLSTTVGNVDMLVLYWNGVFFAASMITGYVGL